MKLNFTVKSVPLPEHNKSSEWSHWMRNKIAFKDRSDKVVLSYEFDVPYIQKETKYHFVTRKLIEAHQELIDTALTTYMFRNVNAGYFDGVGMSVQVSYDGYEFGAYIKVDMPGIIIFLRDKIHWYPTGGAEEITTIGSIKVEKADWVDGPTIDT